MSRFDRYLLSQLLALFGFFSLVLVAVYWVNRAVRLFDRLIGDGHSLMVFLEFSALTLPNVIRIVLPVAAFAATVYATNRLTQDSELVVMQATGFSPFRMARPVLVFGLIVTLLMSMLMHVIVPYSRSALDSRQAALNEDIIARFLHDGRFLHPTEKVTLFIREISERGELEDVFISDERGTNERMIYTARHAILSRTKDGPKLVMFDGMVQRLDGTTRLAVTRFSDFTYSLSSLIVSSGESKPTMEGVPTHELLSLTAAERKENAWRVSRIGQELHTRIAQPLLATAAALVGFATLLLGAFSRFGLWRQIMGAVLCLVFLQFLSTVGSARADSARYGWLYLYAAPAVGFVIATVMLWWAGRPRRLGTAVTGGAAA